MSKLAGAGLIGAVVTMAVSCSGLAGVVSSQVEALEEPGPAVQEAPGIDLSGLEVEVIRLQDAADKLECPANYAEQRLDDLAEIARLVTALNDAQARAEVSDVALAAIRSAITPAAPGAAQEE